MVLQISQHINNRALLNSIASPRANSPGAMHRSALRAHDAKYFKSPTKVYYQSKTSIQITLTGFDL